MNQCRCTHPRPSLLWCWCKAITALPYIVHLVILFPAALCGRSKEAVRWRFWMPRGTLLPSTSEVDLACLRAMAGSIEVQLRTSRPVSSCPVCGISSRRVHSRYLRRRVISLGESIPVSIQLRTRRFFYVGENCRRQIFTEPLSGTVLRYGRGTAR